MYLLYVDESGVPEAHDSEHFVLAGLAVFERRIHWLVKEVEDIHTNYFGDAQRVEFHAQAISAHRSQPWRSMNSRLRDEILTRLYTVLVNEHDSTRLFDVSMHKPSFPNDDPVESCFEQLTSRFDQYMTRLHHQGNTQRALIIMDESKYQRRLRTLLARYKTTGHRWGQLKSFADVPFFSDSKATRMLQLADLISWAIFRRYERGDTRYFDRIINRFDAEGGRLHGLIHLTGDYRSCMCPPCMSRHSASHT